MRGAAPPAGASIRRRWGVNARVERFSEPAVLLLLRERPAHGYELLEQLGELIGESRVDMGNLYRAPPALEAEGLVTSNVRSPTGKRTLRAHRAGAQLLDQWAVALREPQERTTQFLRRYEERR